MDDTVNTTAGTYRLELVHGKITPQLRDELIAFWQQNNVLPQGTDGAARAQTVVYIARNPQGAIAGVTSANIANFLKPKNPHYFYRMMVQPADRSFTLTHALWQRTGDALAAAYTPGSPRGIVIIAENRKLSQPGLRRLLTRGGYIHLGTNPKGYDLWLRQFAPAYA
jgi:hypothetical protein